MKRSAYWPLMAILLMSLSSCEWIRAVQRDTQTETEDSKTVTRSEAMSDLTQTTALLQEYYVLEGKFPESLDALKLELYHPEDLNYDPKTGKLRSKTYPDL